MTAKQVEEIQIPATLIDEFGAVFAMRDGLKADLAPVEKLYVKLRDQIGALIAGAPADTTFLEAGDTYTLDISERKNERTVDIAAARKKLGAAGFLAVCSVTQSALNDVLPKPEVEKLLVTSQTGQRSYVPALIAAR